MMVPVLTGPTPKTSVRLVPEAFDRCGEFLVDLAQLGIQVADVSQELGGELAAGLGNRARRRDLAEDAAGLGCGDLPADTAGNQAAAPRAAGRRPGCGPGPGPGAA